jgi:methionyl aminopeptidase
MPETRMPRERPEEMTVIELRTPAEIEQMAVAGRFVASVLHATAAASAVGINLLELDEIAGRMIRERGAESCYVDYHPSFGGSPFGKFICTSVNDAALHGLPHNYLLRDGDLLSLDFAASVGGWVCDSAVSLIVGVPRAVDAALIRTVDAALDAGIAAVRPGAHMGDVSAAIGAVAKAARLKVNLDFGGHGVGHTMHEDPHVANNGKPGRGLPLRAGMVFAIEPWFMLGTDRIYTDDDGWTLRSADGSRAAHAEHTVAVTESGPRVLTLGQ